MLGELSLFQAGLNGKKPQKEGQGSLMRLGLSCVEILVIHDLDEGYHGADGLVAHRRDLESSGYKLKPFGLGTVQVWRRQPCNFVWPTRLLLRQFPGQRTRVL